MPSVSIVPRPRFERVERNPFLWTSHVLVRARGAPERAVAGFLRAYLRDNGVVAEITTSAAHPQVTLDATAGYDARLGDEGYSLRVGPGGVTLRANTPHGLFYALQTLEQISARSGNRLRTRAGTIVDWPAHRWRGIHLDVARHFFAVPVIERYIDVAAHYKLNTFHWHLTDDQGWRLRSERYPALSSGPRYTHADVREIVAYAASRHVTVVPEIDLPGHAAAALRAYPRLSCGHDTLCTTGAGLAFARDVWGEAMRAFPSPYAHTGGDEVPPASAAAQPKFTEQLERYVHARGRRMIGWDEILTPHLAPRAMVMVWTAPRSAAEAARHGNDVIVASGALHFDAAQGDAAQEPPAAPQMSTLEQVYAYRIVPPGLTPSQTKHILGGQASVWTEHIATPERLFSMTLPRLLALSETLWTPRERKDWDSFLGRLPAQFAWLDAHHYPFRIPNAAFSVTGGAIVFEAVPGRVQSVRAWTTARRVTIALGAPVAGGVIRYTTDGSAPTAASRAFRAPFTAPIGGAPTLIRAAVFLHGRTGTVTECSVTSVSRASLRARPRGSASWSALVSP